jgi:amino-acid N-acetyltransferase
MGSDTTRGHGATPFSEKAFYLREFQGRTLALAIPARDRTDVAPLVPILLELEANRTRVVLISPAPSALEALPGTKLLAASGETLEGAVWRGFADAPRVGLVVEGERAFAPACAEIALRLGVPKLVWIDADGGLVHTDGSRLSFVDLEELRGLRGDGFARESAERAALLAEVERALVSGLPAVNLCTPEGLADELFTYAGVGTLFTRERYVEVRRLGIDDYDAADDLVARGVAEGYLAPRSPAEVDRVLASGFGAFVEGRYLAGIGALLDHPGAGAGEIASLYTLTRFLGEGVGAHLVAFALECAREHGHRYAFACTTSERVVRFFERQGFGRVDSDAVPPAKWRGYDPERRARAVCLRRVLSEGVGLPPSSRRKHSAD